MQAHMLFSQNHNYTTSYTSKTVFLYMFQIYRGVYKELDLYTSLREGDVLTMVLKNPAEDSRAYTSEYGKSTCNMLIPQSDRGLSAFFAILRYLASLNKQSRVLCLCLICVKELLCASLTSKFIFTTLRYTYYHYLSCIYIVGKAKRDS